MKNKFRLLIISMLLMGVIYLSGCTGKEPQAIPQMDFETFEPLLNMENDTVYVINFWATWCKPCVKELPDFERLNADYADEKLKVILVSLDFPNKYQELLLPFVAEKNLQSSIIHLTDVDANKWIDKVSPKWSGAIPATIVYKGSDREFYEAQLNYEKLKSIVEPKL